MLSFLRLSVVAAFILSLVSLIVLVLKTFAWGRKKLNSQPRGKASLGIFYALGRGLLPWEKESTVKNLPTYMAGILYHTGIFSALVYLGALVIPLSLSVPMLSVLRITMLGGLVSGAGLLIRRALKTTLRGISCPDDYTSNILVDLFLATAIIASVITSIEPLLFALSVILFLYIPVGKIRHCFFFFYSRILFGNFFGRRGILPRAQKPLKSS